MDSLHGIMTRPARTSTARVSDEIYIYVREVSGGIPSALLDSRRKSILSLYTAHEYTSYYILLVNVLHNRASTVCLRHCAHTTCQLLQVPQAVHHPGAATLISGKKGLHTARTETINLAEGPGYKAQFEFKSYINP